MEKMTMEEVVRRYNIPEEVLREYESRLPCVGTEKPTDARQYDQTDIERLSFIMTLHDVGFTNEETWRYMRLVLSDEDTSEKRAAMLREKRNGTLDEIHLKQEQLDRLDYLRFEISKSEKNKRRAEK